MRVFNIANKYFVDSLSQLAIVKFKDAALTTWYKDGFADAVAEVYGATSSSRNPFRQTLFTISSLRARELFRESETANVSGAALHDNKFFKTVAAKTPDFLMELVHAQAWMPWRN